MSILVLQTQSMRAEQGDWGVRRGKLFVDWQRYSHKVHVSAILVKGGPEEGGRRGRKEGDDDGGDAGG